MIAIVDYGLGNLRSIQNMFQRIGSASVISRDPMVLNTASKLILPGVGHFAFAMTRLRELRLIDVLNALVMDKKVPILGICLGAQLLGQHSEEGNCEGLGWIPMKTIAFDRSKMPQHLKLPHMGWAETTPVKPQLFAGLPAHPRFYYVHSFHFSCESDAIISCVARHGYEFPAGIHQQNIFGLQFHPEKSHMYGLRVLKNFASMEPKSCAASE